MRFYLQRKKSWFNDNFLCVADENREQLFDLKSTIMLAKRTIRVLDADRNDVAVIKQELKSLSPKYSVYVNGEKRVTVKRLLNPLIPKYEVEGGGWELRFELMHRQYDVCKNGSLIATVIHEDYFSRPSRRIDMADGSVDDQITALALAVAIEYGINFEALQTAQDKSND